jgi:sarcosine oxidase subunit beta
VYFRPEGRDLMLVGLEAGNEVGGSPDRPMTAAGTAMTEEMIDLLCRRLPWMVSGTLRTAHGGQDGITPDQRAILGGAGPDGFYLACGFSGTGFKTAPAVGICMSELIIDGRAKTVDISGYDLARFDEGRLLVGEHPYHALWR